MVVNRLKQGNTSPVRENPLSAGYVPVLSKYAPSSCYTQQRLGKKNMEPQFKVASTDKK